MENCSSLSRNNDCFKRREETEELESYKKDKSQKKEHTRQRLLLCFEVERCTKHAHYDYAKDDTGNRQHLALVHFFALCEQQN